MQPQSLSDIQAILRKHRDELRRDFAVDDLGIFGSYARGEAQPDSDIDILVSFTKPVGFFAFLRLEERLSELLGTNVDLVTKPALKPRMGKRILAEVQQV